jgi:Ca2+-binding EF-hand superfamily protein
MSDRKQMFEEEHLKEAFNFFDLDRTGFIEKN